MSEADTGRCGTSTGYSDHWKRKTPPCDRCKAARARHQAGYMKRRYLNGGRPVSVDPLGTRRRIEALVWMGYSYTHIGKHLGCRDTQVRLLTQRKRILPESAKRVRELYEELCMTKGPSVRAANFARRSGFAPPLAWLDIDDPLEVSLTELTRAHEEALHLHRQMRANERRIEKRVAAKAAA